MAAKDKFIYEGCKRFGKAVGRFSLKAINSLAKNSPVLFGCAAGYCGWKLNSSFAQALESDEFRWLTILFCLSIFGILVIKFWSFFNENNNNKK